VAQCPECDEQFVPEGLEPTRPYNPEEEDTFAVAGVKGPAADDSKRNAIRRGIKRKENRSFNDDGPKKTVWQHVFDGKDSFLLVIALIFGLFAPTMYLLVTYANKKSPTGTMTGGVIACYVLGMILFAIKIWRGQRNAGRWF
jgi:hypothetical protein